MQNVQRLNNANDNLAWKKLKFMKEMVSESNCDVLFLIDVGDKANELIFPNYKVFSDGRNVLAIKNNIKLDVKTKLNWPIFVVNNSDLRFVYVRPNENDKEIVDQVRQLIEENKCVIGDLNLKSNPVLHQAVKGRMVLGEVTEQTVIVQKKLTARIKTFNAPSDHKGLLIDLKKYLCHNAGVKLIAIDYVQSEQMINQIFDQGIIQTPIKFKTEARLNEGSDEDETTKDLLVAYLNNDLKKCYKTYENWWKKLKKEPFLGCEVPESVEISLKQHYRHNPGKKYCQINVKEMDLINPQDLNPKEPSYSKAKTNELIALKEVDKFLAIKWSETEHYDEKHDNWVTDQEMVKKFLYNFVNAANLNRSDQSCKTFFLRKNKNRLELFHDVRIIIIMPIFMKIWEALIYKKIVQYLEQEINIIKYQHGGIEGGSTYDTLFDVQKKYMTNNGKAILFIDIEKGYDSVNWDILCNIINDIQDVSVKAMLSVWFKLLINLDVNINQNRIKKARGLGMGLTLAPIMFVYYVHKALIKANTNRQRISMYVDDLAIVLNQVDDELTYSNLVSTFKDFEMNINENKCSILTVDEKIKDEFKKYKIVIKNSEKYLGVQLRIDKENTFEVDNRFTYIKNEFFCLPKVINFAVKKLIYNGAILAKLRYSAMMFSIKSMVEKKKVLQLIWSLFKLDFPKLSYLQLSMFSLNFIRFFVDLNDLDYIKKKSSVPFDIKDRTDLACELLKEKCKSGIIQIDQVVDKLVLLVNDPREWLINLQTLKELTNSMFKSLKRKFLDSWKEEKMKQNIIIYDKMEIFALTKYATNSKTIQLILFRHFDIYKVNLNIFMFDIVIQIGERIESKLDLMLDYNNKYTTFLKEEKLNEYILNLFYNNRCVKAFKTFDWLLNIEGKKEYKEVQKRAFKILCILDNVLTLNKMQKKTLEELLYEFNFKLAMDLKVYDIVGEIIDKENSFIYKNVKELDVNEASNIFSVDGSFNSALRIGGAGIVMKLKPNKKAKNFFFEVPSSFSNERNVAGELLATLWAIKKAKKLGLKHINLIFDYLGNVMYAKNIWSSNTKLSKLFVRTFNELMNPEEIEINWYKADSHTNIQFNDEADRLAKIGAKVIEKLKDDIEVSSPLRNRDYMSIIEEI